MIFGLTVPEIARAFLEQESTMGQPRTAVHFHVFNEGYLATGADTDPVRENLTARARLEKRNP